jgi:putative oxidoreductase
MFSSPWEDRQARIGSYCSLGLYVVAILALGLASDRLNQPMLIIGSLLPSLAIALQLWFAFKVLDRLDEYLRALLTKRFLIAGGLTMIVSTTWGFLETFARLPHVPCWFVYPLFWAAFGVATPLIRSSK